MSAAEPENPGEGREDIPLKKGTKSSKWYKCNEDCLGGSKFINLAFATLTVVITIALLIQIHYGDYQVTPHGSVASDSLECSEIGTSILKQGGNAVDAAIASAFCLTVTTPHVASLDSEGLLMIYNHRKRLLPNVIDFSPSSIVSESLPKLVLGLAYTHQQFGKLAWKKLVEPAAILAKNGFLIPKMLVEAIKKAKAEHLFGRLESGQTLKIEALSETLQRIADIPEKELYAFITADNEPVKVEANKGQFYGFDIYVPSETSVGNALFKNLEEIEKFNFTKNDGLKPEYTYRLAETTQIIYNELNFTKKYHQGTTTNIAVMDMNDNYVSLVMGMYSLFGSVERSEAGYVLDVKNKERICTRIPVILTDSKEICGKRLVFGSNDIAIASEIIASLLIAGKDVTDTVEAPRFHMFINGSIGIEGSHSPLFNDDVLKYLESLTSSPLLVTEPYNSCNMVEKYKDDLTSHSDSRGGGIASRF